MGKRQKLTQRFFDQVDFFGIKTEFLGTFLIVYFSGWAFMHMHFEKTKGSADLLGVALVNIFTYGLMTWVAYLYSGAIFNPAILIVLVCFRKVTLSKGLFYLLAQMSASVVAASLLRAIAPEDLIISYSKEAGFLGFPNTDLSFAWVLVYEALGTCLVICTYYTSVLSKRAPKLAYGMTMGMAYGGMVLVFGDKTGAACNPARIFGPAMIEKKYFSLFEYYSGHLVGSLLGAFISEVILLPTAQSGDMMKDKGANLNIKTELKDKLKGTFIEEVDSDDDNFDGKIEDLKAIDEKNRKELEERDREGKKKYFYDDSSDEETDHRKIKKRDQPKDYEKGDYVPKIYEEREKVREPGTVAEIKIVKANQGNEKTLQIEKVYREREVEEQLTAEQLRQQERKQRLDQEKQRAAQEKAREEELRKQQGPAPAARPVPGDVPPPPEELDELPPLEEPENM